MKKAIWIVLSLIVLAVFNVIAFVAPLERTNTYWIGYAFCTLAILVDFFVNISTQSGKELKSRFYGWPLMIVAFVYMAVQLVISLVFMIASTIQPWIAIIVCVICLAVFMIGLIAGEAAKGTIEKIDTKVKQKTFYIKSLESDLRLLCSSCDDTHAQKSIKELADAIRFSDPMSAAELSGIENSIAMGCDAIKTLVESRQYDAVAGECQRVAKLLAARNEKCKLLK